MSDDKFIRILMLIVVLSLICFGYKGCEWQHAESLKKIEVCREIGGYIHGYTCIAPFEKE